MLIKVIAAFFALIFILGYLLYDTTDGEVLKEWIQDCAKAIIIYIILTCIIYFI